MKLIPLTQGQYAIVDDEDFASLSQFKWCLHHGYAVRNAKKCEGQKRTILMHRQILIPTSGVGVDHKDLNRLNNQKSNLRLCTQSQNNTNRKKYNGYLSKFKGVSVQTSNNKYKYYRSAIIVNGRHIIKLFPFTPDGEVHAALWYNDSAKKYFGEFAQLNQIPT